MHQIIQELFADHQVYHSDYQKDHFITVKSGITPYGQYKQAIRELYTRFTNLQATISQHDLLHVKLLRRKAKLEQTQDTYDRMEYEIKNKRDQAILDGYAITIRETKKEFGRFLQHALYWKNYLGDKLKNKEALEREFWLAKTLQLAYLDMNAHGGISRQTYELADSLDNENLRTFVRIQSMGINEITRELNRLKGPLLETDELPEIPDFNKLDYEKINLLTE